MNAKQMVNSAAARQDYASIPVGGRSGAAATTTRGRWHIPALVTACFAWSYLAAIAPPRSTVYAVGIAAAIFVARIAWSYLTDTSGICGNPTARSWATVDEIRARIESERAASYPRSSDCASGPAIVGGSTWSGRAAATNGGWGVAGTVLNPASSASTVSFRLSQVGRVEVVSDKSARLGQPT